MKINHGEAGPDLLLAVDDLGTDERFTHMQHLEFLPGIDLLSSTLRS
jgi:hypothetical protein